MENEILYQTSEVMEEITSQTQTAEGNSKLINTLFVLVGISMVFEYFVRKYKIKIKEEKQENKDYKQTRKKLWIVYGIHFAFTVIFALIVRFVLKMPDVFMWGYVFITIYVVEIETLFNFSFKRKKQKE